jgi:hypothetical protein
MAANENDSLTAVRQDSRQEKDMPGNTISVALTATDNGDGTISVTGSNGGTSLPTNSGAARFSFTLTDNTGFNVKFASLDAADNNTSCPPPPGENSQQITGVVMNNDQTPRTAAFTDNNSNNAANGPMSISYAWNFTCDPGRTVGQYDPIITNGGKTGPL